ncbi:MAG: Na/Pi symporter [Gemmatimonadales bacterium]|nr:Na/Pi symporter [Gemmatimonadales bacterium]MBT5045315.1 Na/Pi symporter [Gemmatimonadales bacterium]MBT7125573.1 Na/Pi symporter [Gemmatimonadales bacterium]MBT7503130.1 Na/Pi symporter [Gemmatimonadales bacterium]
MTDPPRLGIQLETKPYIAVLQAVAFLLCLYLFFASIELMSAAFKMSGRGLAEQLLNTASDPLAGLLIGFLATSMIQSSSTTTTIVVGLVASGALTIELAVPIIMGANIGTTTTNTIVAIGHVTRPAEFERAFAASTVHDFFNLLAAFTILPIEVFFHPVQKSAVFLQSTFAGAGGMKLASPLKVVIRPLADFVTGLVPSTLPLMIIALLLLFIALRGMMKIMQGAVLSRLEGLFDRVLFRNDAASFTLGVVATASVQSSSATTSLIVPLAGTGVLSLRQVFPYTLGANIGTTITAILASFATGSPAAVTVALAHLSFNIFAIVIYYPLKALPLWMATKWGRIAAQSKGNTAGVFAVYIAAHVIPLMYILWSARR